MTKNSDLIGFLPIKRNIRFCGGHFLPVDDFDSLKQQLDSYTHKDGFLYPPLSKKYRLKSENGKWMDPKCENSMELIPNTERPAPLYRLPPSHQLILDEPCHEEDFRTHDAAFLMFLASYLYGYRLQFHGWLVDGRASMRSTHNISISQGADESFFSTAYKTWREWPKNTRLLCSNMLFMNSRANISIWDWERFTVNYMVFDACYRIANHVYGVTSSTHGGRLTAMFEQFGIQDNEEYRCLIVRLRNQLFHEALWDGGQPGTGSGEIAWRQSDNLRKINRRIIPALFGFDSTYTRTSWVSLGTSLFDDLSRISE